MKPKIKSVPGNARKVSLESPDVLDARVLAEDPQQEVGRLARIEGGRNDLDERKNYDQGGLLMGWRGPGFSSCHLQSFYAS